MVDGGGDEDDKEFSFDVEIKGATRPWGNFFNVFESPYCKVKHITVKPGHKISYQYHYYRKEYWQIVSGHGIITINGIDLVLRTGGYVRIAKEVKHRIRNDGDEDLIFIEIQTGEYFGEDDIVRIEDDYGRV